MRREHRPRVLRGAARSSWNPLRPLDCIGAPLAASECFPGCGKFVPIHPVDGFANAHCPAPRACIPFKHERAAFPARRSDDSVRTALVEDRAYQFPRGGIMPPDVLGTEVWCLGCRAARYPLVAHE